MSIHLSPVHHTVYASLFAVSCCVFLVVSVSPPSLALSTLFVHTSFSLPPPPLFLLTVTHAVHIYYESSDSPASLFFQSPCPSLWLPFSVSLSRSFFLCIFFFLCPAYTQYFPVYFLLSLYLTGSPLHLSVSFLLRFFWTLSLNNWTHPLWN